MNKTVTINISGIIFHIEEDAYERLSKYLAAIKGYFSKTEGGNEILSDIESRIAELLQEKLHPGKQVVVAADVDYAVEVMGKPEDFAGEADNSGAQQTQTQSHVDYSEEKIKRRLFRNPDEKAIGGVCSGLAAYFDVDTVWVRLAMFLLIFFGGLSLWVYIILWIVIPEAKTTADKFAMRGESANINNIFKSFKEEAEDVKNRFTKQGHAFKNNSYTESIRSNVSSVLGTIFNIIGRLFGLFLLLIGTALLIGYIISLTGISILNANNDVSHWKSVIFASPTHYALGVLAFIIVFGIPLFMLLYTGIKLLFKIRYSNRWLNMSMGFLWLVGVIIGVGITVLTLKQFAEMSKIKQSTELQGIGDTLIIKMNPAAAMLKGISSNNADDLETYFNHNKSGYTFNEIDRELGIIGFVGLTVVESDNDSVELVISKSARGYDKKEANDNAREIKYNYSRQGNVLYFDELFTVTPGSKFRTQELDIKIKLPKGKVIYFDRSVKNILDDVENTTNTYDGDMISRRWKMTDKGLTCIDCENLQSVDGSISNETKDEKIEINREGIHVNGKETEIKIDKDGIKIHTPEKKSDESNEENQEKK